MLKYFKYRYRLLKCQVKEMFFISKKSDIVIPPPKLRYRVHGSLEPNSYVQAGVNCWRSIKNILEGQNLLFESFNEVLDFGCGCGRVLVNIPQYKDQNIHGWDIDSESVNWCQNQIVGVRFSTIEHNPPVIVENHSFDFIYSISVFTHLNEKMQLEWLKELSRILKPNGYAIVSVHGEFHRQIKQSKIEILDGFKFKVLEKGIFKRDGLPDFYQDAQHTRNYIMKVWSRYFDVVNYIEKGINGHQDAVVLKSK